MQTLCKTAREKLYTLSKTRSSKTIPWRAAHTYIVNIWEYPPRGLQGKKAIQQHHVQNNFFRKVGCFFTPQEAHTLKQDCITWFYRCMVTRRVKHLHILASDNQYSHRNIGETT